MEQSGYISEWQNLLLTLTSLYMITFKDSIKVYDSVLRLYKDSQYFYTRRISIWHNLIDVELSVYHRNHLHGSMMPAIASKNNGYCDL